MHEIVTLQLGQLSNYVATHFWNTQEAYFTYSSSEDQSPVDHNIHWRAGLGADGSETFLPRTVIYDLKGGFGSFRKINALYEPEPEATATNLWNGSQSVHKQPVLTQSEYQKSLDAGTQPPTLTTSNIRYWSDYSRVFLHPRSAVQLYDFELNSTTMPFERFSMGSELFGMLDKEHDIVDRDWRPFVEESDMMQGIQIFTTLDDAWGGFASSYLEVLRDEHPKTCIWVWGLQNPTLDTPRSKRQLRSANNALSIDQMRTQATTIVPLAVPESADIDCLSLDLKSPWHVSAAMATAAETATLPSRLRSTADVPLSTLDYLAQSLDPSGSQPLSSMALTVKSSTADANRDDSATLDFFYIGAKSTSKHTRDAKLFGQVTISRGLDQSRTDLAPLAGHLEPPAPGNPVVRTFESSLRFPMLDSFPRIHPQVAVGEDLDTTAVLSSSTSIGLRVKDLRQEVTRMIGLDDREELRSGLADLADAYQDEWDSGSDEDDDDF